MNTQRKILLLIIITFTLILVGLFFVYQSFIADGGRGISGGVTTDRGGRNPLFPGSSSSSNDNAGINKGIQRQKSIPTLRQISSAPASGGVVFTTQENTIIRYVDRATGHIFETTKNSFDQNRISNTTIPRIQEGVWSADGSMVILRYLDEDEIIKSFYGKVSQGAGVIEGTFMNDGITDIAVHQDGDLFYIQKTGNSSQGISSNFDSTNKRTVFSSKIFDWIPVWIGGSVGVLTKASRDVDGFLYTLRSGARTKILSGSGLLVKLNKDGTKILFSTSDVGGTQLFMRDIDTKKVTEIPFVTLAEKCVWGSLSVFFCASPHNTITDTVPDDWYKGVLSFSDDIWSYDTRTQTAQLIYDSNETGQVFDAINLVVDGGLNMLLFTDKNNFILWGLSL